MNLILIFISSQYSQTFFIYNFTDASANEQQDLFVKKLHQCCVVFDFMDPVSDLKSKEVKRSCLNELVDYVTVTRGVLQESVYPEIIRMVSHCVSLQLSSYEEFFVLMKIFSCVGASISGEIEL